MWQCGTWTLVVRRGVDEAAKDKIQLPLDFQIENLKEESDAEDPTLLQHALQKIQICKRASKKSREL